MKRSVKQRTENIRSELIAADLARLQADNKRLRDLLGRIIGRSTGATLEER